MSSSIDALTTLLGSLDIISQLQSFSILTATFNGIMLWEVATCFPTEVKHIFWPEFKALIRDKKLPPPASFLLVTERLERDKQSRLNRLYQL